MNPMEHTHSEAAVESAILAELRATSLAPAELKARVRNKVAGFKDKQWKSYLDSLVATQRIHGRPKLAKNGKPTKTLEVYAYGAPPPPPPPPLPPRELAPKEILSTLNAGPLSADELKKRVKKNVPELTASDYASILAALVKANKVFGRRKIGANGKPTKTVESYVLGGPPVAGFIAPVLAKWNEMRREAASAGIRDQALVQALLDGLEREGVSVGRADAPEFSADDHASVLRGVRDLVAREGQGALIPIRKLRATVPLAKDRLDTALLELYAEDALILHHHDYVGRLSDGERDELVLDRHGNYYIGVALRGAQ